MHMINVIRYLCFLPIYFIILILLTGGCGSSGSNGSGGNDSLNTPTPVSKKPGVMALQRMVRDKADIFFLDPGFEEFVGHTKSNGLIVQGVLRDRREPRDEDLIIYFGLKNR